MVPCLIAALGTQREANALGVDIGPAEIEARALDIVKLAGARGAIVDMIVVFGCSW
jgi:hypothetical protein